VLVLLHVARNVMLMLTWRLAARSISHVPTPSQDDVAKITNFVLNDNGEVENKPVLEPRGFAAAMQRDPTDRGLSADNPSKQLRYNFGFWAQRYPGAQFGCFSDYYQVSWGRLPVGSRASSI
jgi:hypothetical protein